MISSIFIFQTRTLSLIGMKLLHQSLAPVALYPTGLPTPGPHTQKRKSRTRGGCAGGAGPFSGKGALATGRNGVGLLLQ